MIYYFENEELKFPYYVLIFALLNFNVFCSYYLFVPFTYSALWIYFCIYSKRNNKKIICKKNIILLSITLLIPFLLGYIYHFAPGIYNVFNSDFLQAIQNTKDYSEHILGKAFSNYGYIYVNFYSNMLLLIPLVLYYIYKHITNIKPISFDIIYLFLLILFIIVLIVGMEFEKVSTYFIMKNYYALWTIMIYINFRGLMYLYEKNKPKVYAIIVFYIMIIILTVLFKDTELINAAENVNETPMSVAEIFGVNKTIITDRDIDINLEQIEILKYARQNLDFENKSIEILGEKEQLYWTYSFLRYINKENTKAYLEKEGQQLLNLKAKTAYKKIGMVDYIIYFNDNKYYEKAKDILFNNSEIVYQNKSGGIIKYNI